MSCNIILNRNDNKNTSIKGLDKLSTCFDVVEIEEKEKYNLLTCKDRVVKANDHIQYVVWLQLKINKTTTKSNYGATTTSEEFLERCVADLNNWVDLLINFEKKGFCLEPQQLSLFDEPAKEGELILEKLPNSPTGGEDNSWNSYFTKCAKIKISNLKKQYTFFELYDDNSASYIYREVNWRAFIPSDEKVLEEMKRVITKYKNNPGRYDDGWFDDVYNYVRRDGALSDYELYTRVRFQTRLFFVHYTSFKHANVDLSFNANVYEDRESYRYWFDGKKMNGNSFDNILDNKEYDFFEPDFVQWLRDTLNVPYKDYDTDEFTLKNAIEQFMCGYSVMDNWKEVLNKCNTSKEFVSEINTYLTIVKPSLRNGGSSLCCNDGYGGGISYDKKGSIKVTQNLKIRDMLGRDTYETTSYLDEDALIYDLNGNDIYIKAFELFKTNSESQSSLFDFL